jgi:hypothetical protein
VSDYHPQTNHKRPATYRTPCATSDRAWPRNVTGRSRWGWGGSRPGAVRPRIHPPRPTRRNTRLRPLPPSNHEGSLVTDPTSRPGAVTGIGRPPSTPSGCSTPGQPKPLSGGSAASGTGNRDRRISSPRTPSTSPARSAGSEAGVPCQRDGISRTTRVPCHRRITAACPLVADHTPGPTGYGSWRQWAEQMTRTHRQATCDGCGGWLIWIPKEIP